MSKFFKVSVLVITSFIFSINYSIAKDYVFKKHKLLFDDASNVYKISYSKSGWSKTSKTLSYIQTNKSNELVSAFIGFHLPITTNPRWTMDIMRDVLLGSPSPLSDKELFNFHKNTTSRHLYVGEINLKNMKENVYFNLKTLMSRANKKYNIVFPTKLLSSIHVTINARGIYFISYLTNQNLEQNVSLNPSAIKTNANLTSYMNDWIALSIVRENILSEALKLKPLKTEYQSMKLKIINNDERYYLKKFNENELNKIAANQDDNSSNQKDEIANTEEEKKKKELLAQKKAEEEKKKKELLAQKKAEEEKKPRNKLKKILKSNFKDSDFIALANLTPSAPHALYNLTGELTFDKRSAAYCYFNSSSLKKLEDVYFKKLFTDKYKIQFFYFQNKCDILTIFENDIILTNAKNLISLKTEDFSKFEDLYKSKDLKLINFSRSADIQIFFELRKEKSKELKKSILNSEIEGFGSIVLKNDSNELCLVTPKDEKKHLFLINKLNDEYALTGYEKEYDSIKFGSAEEIFIKIQRNNCGFLYSNETNLKILINAMDKASIEHELISKWFFAKDVEQAELLEQDELIKNQNKLLDKQKKIAEEMEKKKNSGELLKEYTANLRKKHENEVNGFKNYIQKEFEKFYFDQKFEGNFFSDIYDEVKSTYTDLFLKGWVSSGFTIKTIDYGTGVYKGRVIGAHVVNIDTKMKNNELGEYKNMCFQIGILDDDEFSFYRNGGLFECDNNTNLRKWFLKNQFKTLWNPTFKDITN